MGWRPRHDAHADVRTPTVEETPQRRAEEPAQLDLFTARECGTNPRRAPKSDARAAVSLLVG